MNNSDKNFLVNYSKKVGLKIDSKLRVPLTMDGFEIFCFQKGFTVEHYFRNSNDAYGLYCGICSIITSITQRLNNLTEKTDITTDGKGINEIKVNIIKPNNKNENEM